MSYLTEIEVQKDIRERNYLQAQFLAYAPFPLTIPKQAEQNGQLKLKLHSSKGETNWLNITAEQALAIEKILEGKQS